MAETFTYNHADITRYLQGRMPPSEMHDFEKAMLDDPFLADALEGFQNSESGLAAQHLSAIESKLLSSKQEGKVVPLVSKKASWWKAASVILVIATGSFFAYQFWQNENQATSSAPLAMEQKQKASMKADSFSPAEKSLSLPEIFPQDDIAQKRADYKQQSNGNAAQPETRQFTFKDTNDDGVAEQIEVDSKKLAETKQAELSNSYAFSSTPKSELKLEKNDYRSLAGATPGMMVNKEFRGRVTDTTGAPLAFAEVKAKNSNAGTIADANGNFVIKAADSVVDVNVKSMGFASTSARINSNASLNKIILQEDKTSLADVVVTGYAARKNNVIFKENIVTLSGEKIAEPVGGWKKFEAYIASNMDHFRDSMQAQQDEALLVEFDLDQKGIPVDIKSSGKAAYAEIANELIKNGPRWKRLKSKDRVKLKLTLNK